MKKGLMKKACVAFTLVLAMTTLTGCNRKLKVSFDCNADDYVSVGDYKGITVSVDEQAIIDDMVNSRVQNDLDTVTTYETTDRAAQEEDQITVSFTGKVGGQTIDGFCSESYSLVLGKDTFTIDGFVDQLYGLKAGDTKVVTLTIPTTFSEEEYAGKRIVFDINVLTVEAPVAPQITDAYAQENFGYATVAEYKAGIQADMQDEIDEKINDKKKEVVMSKLNDITEVSGYPEDVLNSKIESLNKSMSFYSLNYGMSVDDYCMDRFGLSLEDYAKKSVVQDLALQQIIDKEKLSVDEYYYKGELSNFASTQGYTNVDTFVEKFGKDLIVKNMLIQKAVDVVMDNAIYE